MADEVKSKGVKRKRIEMRLGPLTKDNVGQLKRLNMATFPVRYSDKFYSDLVQDPHNGDLVKLAYHCDILVGGIAGRIEEIKSEAEKEAEAARSKKKARKDKKDVKEKEATEFPPPQRRVYVMTLSVLPAYRGYGIGGALLKLLVDYVEQSKDLTEIYMHVQISNTDALDFYKHHGFEVGEKLENYYKRIDPPHCFIVSRKFEKAVEPPESAAAPAAEASAGSSAPAAAAAPAAPSTSAEPAAATTDGAATGEGATEGGDSAAAKKKKKKKR